MSDNKLVKTILDAATLTGIVAGIGWATKKKVVKENLTSDPSSNVMNYSKFTIVMAASGTFFTIFYSTVYLCEKINERFSRHEEKHESCED